MVIFLVFSGITSVTNITYFDSFKGSRITMIITIVQSLTLVVIVFFLRHRINQFQPNLAKMRLIMVHLANFVILSLIWFVTTSVIPEKRKYPAAAFTWSVEFFAIYLQFFLIYLVIRFTRNMQQAQVEDKVLSKEVPFTVFI